MKLGRCAVKALVYIYISTTLAVKYCTSTTIGDISGCESTLFPLKFFDGAVALPSKQTLCKNNMHPSIATAGCLVPSPTPTNTLHYRPHVGARHKSMPCLFCTCSDQFYWIGGESLPKWHFKMEYGTGISQYDLSCTDMNYCLASVCPDFLFFAPFQAFHFCALSSEDVVFVLP